MEQAKNNPVRRAKPEMSNADFPVGQAPDVSLEFDKPLERTQVITPPDPKALTPDYLQALAFAEEPVTIYIHPSTEKNAPIVVDCWVNGKGAEVFVNGGWVVFNCLPVAQHVTTRRKYVEVLARSKVDSIETEHEDTNVKMPKNIVKRSTSSRCTFQVIGDESPHGREWLRRLMAERT